MSKPPTFSSSVQRAFKHRSFVAGAAIVVLLVISATVSLFWSPYPVGDIDIPNKLAGASAQHCFGTDSPGRDIAAFLLVVSITAIGIFNIPVFARITRGAANAVWSRDFTLAAKAAGKTKWAITWEHVLPNVASVLIVQATVQFAIAILAEAALSYLGLGTQPPNPSWGRMLNEAQSQMFQAPMLAVYPGIAIALAVLGLNLMGDGLRDLLDPRLSRTR